MIDEEDGRKTERLLIQVLCSSTPQGSVKEDGRRLLRGYHWRDADCRAVYDALMGAAAQNPETLRAVLPSRLTQWGFPDIDWDEFFAPHTLSRDEAIALMRQISRLT